MLAAKGEARPGMRRRGGDVVNVWTDIGDARGYTPTREDVGRLLKLELVVEMDAEDEEVIAKAIEELTPECIPPHIIYGLQRRRHQTSRFHSKLRHLSSPNEHRCHQNSCGSAARRRPEQVNVDAQRGGHGA